MNKFYLILIYFATLSCNEKIQQENRLNEKVFFSEVVGKAFHHKKSKSSFYNGNYESFINKNLIYTNDYSISSQLLYACDEEFINPSKIDSNIQLIRFAVMPCFEFPYCISLRKKDNTSKLALSFTDGDGCYNTGSIKMKYQIDISSQVYDRLYTKLESLKYYNIIDTGSTSKDPDFIQIEVLRNGTYVRKGIYSSSSIQSYSQYFRCLDSLKLDINFEYYYTFLKRTEINNRGKLEK